MFKFISNLFTNSTDEVMSVAKGVGGWIDGQQFTDQEKSAAAFKLLEHELKWLGATQGMNVARRYLALMFCISFIFVFMLCVAAITVGYFMAYDVKPLVDAIVSICDSFKFGWIVVTMIVFYFGKGISENIALGQKAKDPR